MQNYVAYKRDAYVEKLLLVRYSDNICFESHHCVSLHCWGLENGQKMLCNLMC